MKDNEKQIFTRREIEKDIKSSYANRIWWCGIVLLFCVFICFAPFVFLNTEKISVVMTLCLIICLIIQIAVLALMVLNIYGFFAPIKYEIVCDVFECEHKSYCFANGIRGFLTFKFKTYGEFILSLALGGPHLHYDKGYYGWSESCSTGMAGLIQSTYRNDEFYLIIINNRIRYIYNKKIFEFKETEKA